MSLTNQDDLSVLLPSKWQPPMGKGEPSQLPAAFKELRKHEADVIKPA